MSVQSAQKKMGMRRGDRVLCAANLRVEIHLFCFIVRESCSQVLNATDAIAFNWTCGGKTLRRVLPCLANSADGIALRGKRGLGLSVGVAPLFC